MRFHSTLFLLLVTTTVFSQINSLIEYNSKTAGKLSWDDFPVSEKISGFQQAFTYCGISYTINSSVDGLNCDYVSFVDLTESWAHKDARTPEQLKHEQGLFDLTEVYARKMSKLTNAYIKAEGPNLTHQSLIAMVRKIYKEQNNLLFLEQQKYNMETNNGKNKELQAVWDKKIASQLKQLEAFKNRN